MPELPEVETSCRGILPHLKDQLIDSVIIRQARLRWPITADFAAHLTGQVITDVTRRGKYILIHLSQGAVLLHLGMSGSVRILPKNLAILPHDHVDIVLANQHCLRFNDPRRFGAMIWTPTDPHQHPLLADLGLEPLTAAFSGTYLFQQSRHRKIPVKQFIMDHHVVVGVGNIYANEALFLAKISPLKLASSISLKRYQCLAAAIQQVLAAAIQLGGTTLRNYVDSTGKPGYFKQTLQVYGREQQTCLICTKPLTSIRIQNRATVFCRHCQK